MITICLVIITIIVSLAAFGSPQLYSRLIFAPYRIERNKEWYRFLSSGFIHADWVHLAVNMFVFYQFGQVTEYYYSQVFGDKGWYYYIILYLGGILIAILPTYNRHKHDAHYHGLGASGAVSAVVFTAILFDPWSEIGLFFFIPMKAVFFAVGYLIYSYYMDKKGNDNVNHNAHFWGAVFGIVYTIAIKPSLAVYFFEILTGGR